MTNELEQAHNNLTTEKIKIVSLEKLDNNYIHIVGEIGYKDVNVVTNGIFTLDFSLFSAVEKIINYNGNDYLIAEKKSGNLYLISLNNGEVLIENAEEIKYIGDGLFGVGEKERFTTEKVYDLNTNNYVPFPDNMIFNRYKDDVLVLKEKGKKAYKDRKEMVIDRSGNTVIPEIDGYISIIDKTKFIVNNMVIDFSKNVILKDADRIITLTNDRIIVLKNRKLFVLNKELEILKTYLIGETKQPWFTWINGEDCIIMTFHKKIRTKKYEPRVEKNVTVIVNTKTDMIFKMDMLTKLSLHDIFKIRGQNHKLGLMNNKCELVLETEYDNIEDLNDANNKYFFVEKEKKHYIFNAENKEMLEVPYTEMKEFRDGLAIGYTPNPRNYQLIDEDLNIVFNLERMGHHIFYYKNGNLCYHSGSWIDQYDAYTIINQSGEILMPSKMCQVKRNNFDLLEITEDYRKKELFDMNSGKFIKLELNVPVIDTKDGQKLDFSRSFSQQFDQSSLLLQEDSGNVKRLLLKPKKN